MNFPIDHALNKDKSRTDEHASGQLYHCGIEPNMQWVMLYVDPLSTIIVNILFDSITFIYSKNYFDAKGSNFDNTWLSITFVQLALLNSQITSCPNLSLLFSLNFFGIKHVILWLGNLIVSSQHKRETWNQTLNINYYCWTSIELPFFFFFLIDYSHQKINIMHTTHVLSSHEEITTILFIRQVCKQFIFPFQSVQDFSSNTNIIKLNYNFRSTFWKTKMLILLYNAIRILLINYIRGGSDAAKRNQSSVTTICN